MQILTFKNTTASLQQEQLHLNVHHLPGGDKCSIIEMKGHINLHWLQYECGPPAARPTAIRWHCRDILPQGVMEIPW